MWDEAQTCFLEENALFGRPCRPPFPVSEASRVLRRRVVALVSGWLGRGLEVHKQHVRAFIPEWGFDKNCLIGLFGFLSKLIYLEVVGVYMWMDSLLGLHPYFANVIIIMAVRCHCLPINIKVVRNKLY